MQTITVILREPNGYPDPLIYVVRVENPRDEEEVRKAVEEERRRDLGDDVPFEVEPLFAFAGDIPTLADWRD